MESRTRPRTQCFKVAHDHDLTPVWVFRQATEDGILGLVVDFSEGGIQVLIEKSDTLDAEAYTLYIDGLGGPPATQPGFRIIPRWTGALQSLYCRCGFEFADPATALDCVEHLRQEVAAGPAWIRCELLAAGAISPS